ncbi:jupiter microtubule associated homolog 1-like [Polyodon spathula]|uniref:jupiter microtubule associated homolog 1-like n=1 Tax=Polyodon spathula TaxID=7913 RepID=UPI001B7E5F10|nr:jupiter microtubule associated homolog 1-like [Polyodon spathula]
MTTTTNYQGMDPGSKNSSRVLRPPGGDSNICFGNGKEEPNPQPTRKNRTASNIFGVPEDPYASRRNNPPGGKPMGIFGDGQSVSQKRNSPGGQAIGDSSGDRSPGDGENESASTENNSEDVEAMPELKEEAPQPAAAAAPTVAAAAAAGTAGPPSRRNPPGGKSSLILG